MYFSPVSISPTVKRKPLFSLHEKSTTRPLKFEQRHNYSPLPINTLRNTLAIEKFGLDVNFEYILKFAVRTQCGLKDEQDKQNQDSYIVCPNIGKKSYMHYFLICDGHGVNGHHVSSYLKTLFPFLINKFKINLENNPYEAIYNLFLQASKALKNLNYDLQNSGSTMVGIFMLHNKIYCSNLGDSRAIMLSRTDKWFIKNLSRDHKPDCQDEAERIVNSGGKIEPLKHRGAFFGPLRVWATNNAPGLAMTRSFGDYVAKTVGVIDRPEIFNFTLESIDRVIIIGSDGVFEFISEQDIIGCIVPYIDNLDIETACNHLLQVSYQSWITRSKKIIDDITFIMIFLSY